MAEDAETSTRAGLPTWATRGPWVLLAVGVLFYFGIVVFKLEAPFWGQMGDSVAPFTALFNVFALFALLYSIRLQQEELRLQRQELKLQRAELRENREEMRAQREQFERTAKAQEALASSQKELADAQVQANRLAVTADRTQRLVASCSLQAAITHMHQAMAGEEYWRMYEPDQHGARAVEQLGRMEVTLRKIAEEAVRSIAERKALENTGSGEESEDHG
jgi:hypothetical protein